MEGPPLNFSVTMYFEAFLDAEMKQLRGKGAGSALARRADVLAEEEEALLWEKGLLGDATLQSCGSSSSYLTVLVMARTAHTSIY